LALKNTLINRVLAAQAVTTCITALAFLSQGAIDALSVLLGGLICLIPNLYLARKLTAHRSADANKLMSTMYAAEFGKIFITMALFAVVFITQKWVQPLILLVGFGIAQLVHWLVPLLESNNNESNKSNQ